MRSGETIYNEKNVVCCSGAISTLEAAFKISSCNESSLVNFRYVWSILSTQMLILVRVDPLHWDALHTVVNHLQSFCTRYNAYSTKLLVLIPLFLACLQHTCLSRLISAMKLDELAAFLE